MKEKIKIGYIGLGRRGTGVLRTNLTEMTDIEITRLCDLSVKRMEEACEIVKEKMGNTPIMSTDYRDILNDPEIEKIIELFDLKTSGLAEYIRSQNDLSIGFMKERTIPKDRPIYFMHGVIRMVRLGIRSHDPPEPEGSTQGQSTR